jgi:hypothetical protein
MAGALAPVEPNSYWISVNMDQLIYDRWWPLHLRATRGEPLSDEERQFYLSWLERLQLSESSYAELGEVEAARQKVGQLEQQQASLRARRDELAFEISAVEEALSQRTRQLLDAKE